MSCAWTRRLALVCLAGLLCAEHNAHAAPPYHAELLWRDAEQALQQEALSVVAKPQTPPSGDKHDYMSIAIYWWPDENKPDGLPWVNRDGYRNPGVDEIPDKQNMNRMRSAVEVLSLAYAHSGDERFAAHAAHLLHGWFLDPETRMNPHLHYAQGIPGRRDGSPTGIIDTAQLGNICDCADLLRGSAAWQEEEHAALQDWFRSYLNWLRDSPAGVAEGLMPNNHAVWYDVQVARYALFVGEADYSRQVCERALAARVAPQIAADGSQPRELRRTKSWHYSIYNLQAFVRLAELARELGVDIWRTEPNGGGSIIKALEFLIPGAREPQSWAYPELQPITPVALAQLLRTAGLALDDQRLLETAAELGTDQGDWQEKLRAARSVQAAVVR